ncbi:MAG: hypothetical protein HeimC2_18550 [Candidatus Heimdallarchaeota archaeon LC_2]|nr:MAG: hypothetical protein HeimC2_18550 [Candidatus Heimdallarchaeota archaeon LC_2]
MKFYKSTILIFFLLTSIFTITGVINKNSINRQYHFNNKVNDDKITPNQYTVVSPIYIDGDTNSLIYQFQIIF